MQREIDPNSSASRTRRYEGSASYFFFLFFSNCSIAGPDPKCRKTRALARIARRRHPALFGCGGI
jgi:hypothetical protein